MASLYRPTYTKPDPKTGDRVTREVRKWYGKYRDATGRLRCAPLSNNKTAAMAMLTDLVRKVELQKAGLVDPCADHLARSIEDHLADFRFHLEAKARSTRHIRETVRIVRNVASACGLKSLLSCKPPAPNSNGICLTGAKPVPRTEPSTQTSLPYARFAVVV